MVFVFDYVVDYVSGLAYVEPALHPWDEVYLIMMDKLFDMLLDSVCQYFIEDFCINVHHGYCPVVFFFSCVSARFWYQDDVGLIERVRQDSLFLYCLESFQKEWYQLLFVHLVEFSCEPICTWTFFSG